MILLQFACVTAIFFSFWAFNNSSYGIHIHNILLYMYMNTAFIIGIQTSFHIIYSHIKMGKNVFHIVGRCKQLHSSFFMFWFCFFFTCLRCWMTSNESKTEHNIPDDKVIVIKRICVIQLSPNFFSSHRDIHSISENSTAFSHGELFYFIHLNRYSETTSVYT